MKTILKYNYIIEKIKILKLRLFHYKRNLRDIENKNILIMQ